MRIIFEVKNRALAEEAAFAIAALQAYGVVKEIAFDPYDEWRLSRECVKRGMPEDKLTEIRYTSANRHLLDPIRPTA